MKKENLNLTLTSILEKHGIDLSTELAKELLALSTPKTKSASNENLPLVGDRYYSELEHTLDDITDLYCNWFKSYVPLKDAEGKLNFNKSTKSKYGYHYECKEAEKHWKAYTKEIAQIKEDIDLEKNAVLDGVKTREEAKDEIAHLEARKAQLEADRLNKVNHPSLSPNTTLADTGVQEDTEETQKTTKKSKKSTKED